MCDHCRAKRIALTSLYSVLHRVITAVLSCIVCSLQSCPASCVHYRADLHRVFIAVLSCIVCSLQSCPASCDHYRAVLHRVITIELSCIVCDHCGSKRLAEQIRVCVCGGGGGGGGACVRVCLDQ